MNVNVPLVVALLRVTLRLSANAKFEIHASLKFCSNMCGCNAPFSAIHLEAPVHSVRAAATRLMSLVPSPTNVGM